jgi:hypothetical protein
MSSASQPHIRSTRRVHSILAAVALCVGAVLSADVAQGRVDPASGEPTRPLQSADAIAKATGGGTVLAQPAPSTAVSSFGLNARRPQDFTGGAAEGRINYNRHKNDTGRHVNAPVVLMQAEPSATPSPNGTGGTATIAADCTATGATCPPGDLSALVYVEDNSDSGTGSDIYRIFFCEIGPFLPGPTFDGMIPPAGCTGPDGGVLRSGNIQVRAEAGVSGEAMSTAAAAGAFSTTPTLNAIELAGGRYGVGVRVASGSGNGDLEVQYNGVSLIGMFQTITISGWITSVSVNGGTWTLSGTGTLDMGDGAPPASGLPLVATLTSSGLAVTINGTAVPSLPKADGFIVFD